MPCTFFENWAHAKIKYLLPVCQIVQKFTEGNARKYTVSFSFFAHVDAIKYWKTLADVFLWAWRITCAFILRVCVMAKLQGARNFWFSCKSRLKVNTEVITNHKGTRMLKDGEGWHGLQTTKLKILGHRWILGMAEGAAVPFFLLFSKCFCTTPTPLTVLWVLL